MYYKNWYVSYIDDCDENKGGYFCQVYDKNDKVRGDGESLDYFCIHPYDLTENHSNLEFLLQAYIDCFFVHNGSWVKKFLKWDKLIQESLN